MQRSTIRWRNTTRRQHRLVEQRIDLFDSGRRPSDADYYYTFPAGRFVVRDAVSGARQRVGIAPQARYGDGNSEIVVRWARVRLGSRYVYDVQIKRGDGTYETLLDGTTKARATLNEPVGDYRFRVRVRNLVTNSSSGWSPPALLNQDA